MTRRQRAVPTPFQPCQELFVEHETIHLYVDAQFASPYAMSAFVALSEKGLAFDVKPIDLSARENQAASYVAQSLTQRVPTLVHGDFTLSESSAISEYIDEVFPGLALYPSEPRARARARQVQAWLRSDLMPIRQERSTEVVFYGARAKPLTANAQQAAQKLFSAATALLPDNAEHICGQWSIADVDLALMLNRLVLHGDAVPEHLATYAHRQWQRPSIQKWVRHTRPPL